MSLIDTFSTRHIAKSTRPHFGLGTYLELWRSRRALSKLDARSLEDIGIDSEAAQREARRGFWDVPDTWKDG